MYQLALMPSERNVAFDTPVLKPNYLRCESNRERRLMPTNGLTSVADYFRRAEMSGRWRLGDCLRRICLCRNGCWRGYFAASDPLSRCESRSEAEWLSQRQHRGTKSLLITTSATRVPRFMLYGFSVLRVVSSKGVRITGTRDIASPRKKTTLLNSDLTVEAAAWDAAAVKE